MVYVTRRYKSLGFDSKQREAATNAPVFIS